MITSVVYMLRSPTSGLVKIGVTTNLAARMAAFSTAACAELETLRVIPGDRTIERWLHKHFAAQRVRREWFAFVPEMLTIEPPPAGAESAWKPAVARNVEMIAKVKAWIISGIAFYGEGKSRAEAIKRCAAVTSLTERRVLAILNDEVPNLWADEYVNLQRWRFDIIPEMQAALISAIEDLASERSDMAEFYIADAELAASEARIESVTRSIAEAQAELRRRTGQGDHS